MHPFFFFGGGGGGGYDCSVRLLTERHFSTRLGDYLCITKVYSHRVRQIVVR